MGGYHESGIALSQKEVGQLKEGMRSLADRNLFSYSMWKRSQATGADLLWRVKKKLKLPRIKRIRDGSYLSKIYASDKDRRHDRDGIEFRVIEYTLEGVSEAAPDYRLMTTILNPQEAPAKQLAALYHDRWEIETAFDEFKTHLRGQNIVLRSKRPDLVIQEFSGFMMAPFAIRGIMHEAALKADIDPDRLSFVHSVRVIRRKLPRFAAIPPGGKGGVS